MIKLPIDATDEQILKAVEEWVAAMAQENYQLAYDITYHPDSRGWDIEPQLLKTLIRYYGSPKPVPVVKEYRVTVEYKPQVLPDGRTSNARHEVDRYSNQPEEAPPWGPTFNQTQKQRAPKHAIGSVWYDLAMNGELSDMTALFDLVEYEGGLVLMLDQLRVM